MGNSCSIQNNVRNNGKTSRVNITWDRQALCIKITLKGISETYYEVLKHRLGLTGSR
jgi:hypothetical protein